MRTSETAKGDALSPQPIMELASAFIVDEDRTGPPFAVLFALNMLVGTGGGDTYTESEVRLWMAEAGLSGIVRKETPFGTSLIVGKRAGR